MYDCTPEVVPCSAGVVVPMGAVGEPVVVIVMYVPRTESHWFMVIGANRVPTQTDGATAAPGLEAVAGVPVTSWHVDMPLVLDDWPFMMVDVPRGTLHALSA